MDQPAQQQSLLTLFEEELSIEAELQREPAENPFRKQFGICTHCTGEGNRHEATGNSSEPETRDARPETRIYWCWICHFIGCWECYCRHMC